MAAQAKVLSGSKLDQLIVRLQRHSGKSRDACWRFIVRYGIKTTVSHRRWSEDEIDLLREELVKHSIEAVAKRLKRTPEAIRSILRRNHLSLKDIRCDLFSVESLARALHVRRNEILFWIDQGWLQATTNIRDGKRFCTITPESLSLLYKRHLKDLLSRGLPSQSLFEAYLDYCHAPKHTTGEQLLDVRRDKRERAAYERATEVPCKEDTDDEPRYRFALDRENGYDQDRE